MRKGVEFFHALGIRYEIYEHCNEFTMEKRIGYENTVVLRNVSWETVLEVKESLLEQTGQIIQMPIPLIEKKTLA